MNSVNVSLNTSIKPTPSYYKELLNKNSTDYSEINWVMNL